MKNKLAVIILILLLAGCAKSNGDIPEATPTQTMPPVVVVSPSPEETATPVPTPPESPESTWIPDELDSAVLYLFPDAQRISGLISIGLDGSYSIQGDEYVRMESNELSADLNGDGISDTLTFSVQPLDEPDAYTNKPMQLSLSINNTRRLIHDSPWNDGIFLFIADFDESDEYVDVCIIETGTDIGCNIYINRFDGSEIVPYDRLYYLYSDRLYYDGKGSIYFHSAEHYDKIEQYNYSLKTVVPLV